MRFVALLFTLMSVSLPLDNDMCSIAAIYWKIHFRLMANIRSRNAEIVVTSS